MRKIHALPLLAALTLSACGSDAEEEVAANGGMTSDEVAVAVDGAEMPMPGQYRTSQELLDFQVPGLSDSMAQMVRSAFAEGAAEESTYCLSAEDAANSREEMLRGMAESDCQVSRFDTSGGTIDALMSCPAGEGLSGDVELTGTMDSDSADMVMSFSTQIPQMGDATIRMRVQSERIGECQA